MTKSGFRGCLSGNAIKILAALTMLCDHTGMLLFPKVRILRIIGRIAFPLFAFMIAEGAAHTRNMPRYLGRMALVALVCQIFYGIADRSFFQCIMVTFTLSLLILLAVRNLGEKKDLLSACLCAGALAVAVFVCEVLPRLLPGIGLSVDYGIIGVLLPVVIYLIPNKYLKLLAAGAMLCLLASTRRAIQWYSLLSLPILLLYNGERGKAKLKWFFYLFYPLHLAALYLIKLILAFF